MKLKMFYYLLYAFVMIGFIFGILYLSTSIINTSVLPTMFHDISLWIALDEWQDDTKEVSAHYYEIKDGYYYPEGNVVYAIFSGIIVDLEPLTLISDDGIVVTYDNIQTNVKKDERIRHNDTLGTCNQPIQISFNKGGIEISYEEALQD